MMQRVILLYTEAFDLKPLQKHTQILRNSIEAHLAPF